MKWNRVTEVLPQDEQEVLVCVGHFMFIATSEIYSKEDRERALETLRAAPFTVDPKTIEHWEKCPGRFKELISTYNMDDPSVFWAELPAPPEGK